LNTTVKPLIADGANHVYFFNRSSAYLSKGDAYNGLEDAKSCLGLNSQFAKIYSLKGSALRALKRYNDSIAAYNDGLEKFPTDAGLQKGLQTVTKEKKIKTSYMRVSKRGLTVTKEKEIKTSYPPMARYPPLASKAPTHG
jgi:tetratricopeptide (TPR) repeat protein